jgi:hypothetical protein
MYRKYLIQLFSKWKERRPTKREKPPQFPECAKIATQMACCKMCLVVSRRLLENMYGETHSNHYEQIKIYK